MAFGRCGSDEEARPPADSSSVVGCCAVGIIEVEVGSVERRSPSFDAIFIFPHAKSPPVFFSVSERASDKNKPMRVP